MVRLANTLFLLLSAAPVFYIVLGFWVTLGGQGLASDPAEFVQWFLVGLAISTVNVVTVVLSQTSKWVMTKRAQMNPAGWPFNLFRLGAIPGEGPAVYGLVLTLLSGSIIYAIGFALATWACLWWVRMRFMKNLQRIPDS